MTLGVGHLIGPRYTKEVEDKIESQETKIEQIVSFMNDLDQVCEAIDDDLDGLDGVVHHQQEVINDLTGQVAEQWMKIRGQVWVVRFLVWWQLVLLIACGYLTFLVLGK